MSSIELLNSIVDNKNVAIIGHSPSILQRKKNIDKYDVIVRLNFGYPREENKEYVGTRTDVWFSWDGNHGYENLQDKFNTKLWIRFNDYPREYFADLRREQGQDKAPSMGMLAYYAVMKCNPKTVTLFGFDFFKTYDHHDKVQIIDQQNQWHNFKKEEEWFYRTKPENVIIKGGVSMVQKKISNKAIQEVKEVKSKKELIICSGCGITLDYNGKRFGCPKCNTING